MAKTRKHTAQRLANLRDAADAALRRINPLDQTPHDPDRDPATILLVQALLIEQSADKVIRDLVEIAIAQGATWSSVGWIFGTSKQAAWQRFSRIPRTAPDDQGA